MRKFVSLLSFENSLYVFIQSLYENSSETVVVNYFKFLVYKWKFDSSSPANWCKINEQVLFDKVFKIIKCLLGVILKKSFQKIFPKFLILLI